MGLTIRILNEADFDAVNLILQASYGDAENRIPRLRRYRRLQPDGWLMAVLNEQPAGVVGAVDYGSFAYSGLLGVHPDAQRKGIGSELMHELLGWLDGRGCPVVLVDAIAESVPLYRELGFVADDDTLLFSYQGGVELPAPSQLVRPLYVADMGAVAAFDAPLFGAVRRSVFEELLAEHAHGFVARDPTGAIAGYLFAQSRLLGPWVARTRADALDLLAAALPLYNQHAPGVILPATNAEGGDLLLQAGFQIQRRLCHMRRGEKHPGQRALLYGQGSFVMG